MNKFFCLLFTILLSAGTISFAEEKVEGFWQLAYYEDEFKLPTDEAYIKNVEPIVGTFCNNSATDEYLTVDIQTDEESFAFVLHEYGNSVVKNNSAKEVIYDVTMLDASRQKISLRGYMPAGNYILFDDENVKTIVQALQTNNTLSFYIAKHENPTTNYLFTIEDTKGFDEIYSTLQNTSDERDYQKAITLYNSGNYLEALDIFANLGAYKDSADWQTNYEAMVYETAQELLAAGEYEQACLEFLSIKGYKDVDNLLVENDNLVAALNEIFAVGNYVTFGNYPQTETGNDYTPIEWQVLKRDGNKVMLISRFGLDQQLYNNEYKDVTWETCTLRNWLNEYFFNHAFDEQEQKDILTTLVEADAFNQYGTETGKDTQDNVFLLSIQEAEELFSSDEAMWTQPTAYAIAQGLEPDDNGNCWWWLRSPGCSEDYAARVQSGNGIYDGGADPYGNRVDRDNYAVRPVLWLNLGVEISAEKEEHPEGDEPNANVMSYDSVIELIEEVKIENKPLFINGERFTANKSDPNLFFTPKGITFFWTYDTQEGFVWFFENGTNVAYEWDIDIDEPKFAGTLVTNMLTFDAKDYIDYEDGGKISFVLTSSRDFTNPVAIIEYSPSFVEATNTDTYAYEYSDYGAYCEAIHWWFWDVIFNGSTREEYEAIFNSAIKGTDAYETLSKGSKGDAVVRLQTRLNELGYSVGTADGDYGNKTQMAIETFQKDKGIQVTGIADIETQKALFGDTENSNSEIPIASTTNPSQMEAEKISVYSESECQEIAIAYMKEHIHSYLKNPASLQIISVTGGKAEGNEYLFVINYTAMNSFGGYTPGTYYCTVDYTTGEVTMGGTI